MFEREPHQRIAALLTCFDEQMLLRHHCLLGGATALALARGEYREVRHIELICHSVEAYRAMRRAVEAQDAGWLFRVPVALQRVPNFIRHGIRMTAVLDDADIEIRIVLENRIPMCEPSPQDRVAGVWTLAEEDLVATKLLANADRYADDSLMSRDIIDLAMLTADGILAPAGVSKARRVYGRNIDIALVRAKALLLEHEGRLAQYMADLKMQMLPHEMQARVARLDFIDSSRGWEDAPGAPT